MTMQSAQSKPTLTILDVGHGNAAVLRDGGVVIFDTGRGQYVRRFLKERGVTDVDTLLLSHADIDHLGGAASLLLDPDIRVRRVFLNADPSKRTFAHRQLQYAIAEARVRRGTVTETQLTTSLNGRLDQSNVKVEVLYPPPESAMSGVGGRDLADRTITSNSLSAAFRLLVANAPTVLIGSDIEFGCLDDWKRQGITPRAKLLVFPHHGGLPGDAEPNDAGIFAFEVANLIQPEIVMFSIHRTKHNLPRTEVVEGVLKAKADAKLLCTQVPDAIRQLILSGNAGAWILHRVDENGCVNCREGTVEVTLDATLTITWLKS